MLDTVVNLLQCPIYKLIFIIGRYIKKKTSIEFNTNPCRSLEQWLYKVEPSPILAWTTDSSQCHKVFLDWASRATDNNCNNCALWGQPARPGSSRNTGSWTYCCLVALRLAFIGWFQSPDGGISSAGVFRCLKREQSPSDIHTECSGLDLLFHFLFHLLSLTMVSFRP